MIEYTFGWFQKQRPSSENETVFENAICRISINLLHTFSITFIHVDICKISTLIAGNLPDIALLKKNTVPFKSLGPGRCGCNLKSIISKLYGEIRLAFPEMAPLMNATWPHWWFINIGSGNGLVSWSKKAITWVNIDADLCHHMVSLGR